MLANWNIDLEQNKKHPYYFLAPEYHRRSAGLRMLYLLCHHLNAHNHRAYMVSDTICKKHIEYELITPTLTSDVLQYHMRSDISPILVIPDSYNNKNFIFPKVPLRLNYLLHYHDAWKRNPDFITREIMPDEMYFAYSQMIAEYAGIENIFNIPLTELDRFSLPPKDSKRKGKLTYGAKFKSFGGKMLKGVHDGAIEILNHHPKQQSREEIVRLLQTSEVLYVYEDTALISEAILCGCPVVFISNDVFPYKKTLMAKEIGDYGIAYDLTPESLEKAKQTIDIARNNYIALYDKIWPQFFNFIEKTQKWANEQVVKNNITADDYKDFIKYISSYKAYSKKLQSDIKMLIKTLLPDWSHDYLRQILNLARRIKNLTNKKKN